MLLPVVFFLGVVTMVRLAQVNWEDSVWVQGMNRLRHAYVEFAPEVERCLVTSRYDDEAGILTSSIATLRLRTPFQAFVAVPGVVAVLDSVVAGAIAGIAGLGLDVGTGPSIAIAAAVFVVTLVAFIAYGLRTIAAYRRQLDVRFPSPPTAI